MSKNGGGIRNVWISTDFKQQIYSFNLEQKTQDSKQNIHGKQSFGLFGFLRQIQNFHTSHLTVVHHSLFFRLKTSKFPEKRKNLWKFVYILAKQCRSHFNLTNIFDKNFKILILRRFEIFTKTYSFFSDWKPRKSQWKSLQICRIANAVKITFALH